MSRAALWLWTGGSGSCECIAPSRFRRLSTYLSRHPKLLALIRLSESVRVEPDFVFQFSVSRLLGPTPGVSAFGLAVDVFAMHRDDSCLPAVALCRRHKLQSAVLAILLVPANRFVHPALRVLHTCERRGRVIRPVFAGPEERSCVRIVIAHPWSAE